MAWHGAFDGREVGHSNTCARAMRGAIARTIWLQRARGTLLAWPKHACGAILRACAWEWFWGQVEVQTTWPFFWVTPPKTAMTLCYTREHR